MPIFKDSKKIVKIYHGDKPVKQVDYNNQSVWMSKREIRPNAFRIKNASTYESSIGVSRDSSAPEITLEYSKNGLDYVPWTDLYFTRITMEPGESIYVRGVNETLSTGTWSCNRFTGSEYGTGSYEAYGSIMDLCDGGTDTTTPSKSCQFAGLFRDMKGLRRAPDLYITQLVDGCFEGMFKNCISLTQVPVDYLPYTKLTPHCYDNMFNGCTSLTQAPELPATILASYCYYYMFSGCTSLTQAPELPATQLTDDCYARMFSGCTSLTQAPELPAQELSEACYNSMFNGCTSLTQAPKLPALKLVNKCYQGMFTGCTSLTQAPELPATQLAEECYGAGSGYGEYGSGMFENCTALTTTPNISSFKGASWKSLGRMFKGCTSLVNITIPLIEAHCEYMFAGCTSLKDVSNVTISTRYINRGIFEGCMSLVKAPNITGDFVGVHDYTLQYAFRNCTSLVEAPEIPTRFYSNGYRFESQYSFYGMYEGCTSLERVPVIYAVDNCNTDNYASRTFIDMFKGCSKLKRVEIHASHALLVDNFKGWLSGVSPEGVLIKDINLNTWDGEGVQPAHTIALNSPNGVPTGWTVETQARKNAFYIKNVSDKVNHISLIKSLQYDSDPKIESSADALSYAPCDMFTGVDLKPGEKLYLRGRYNGQYAYTCSFTSTDLFECGGAVADLSNGGQDNSCSNLTGLFMDAVNLVRVNDSLTNIYSNGGEACREMFAGCTSLESINALMYTKYSGGQDYIFENMFKGCKKLNRIDWRSWSSVKYKHHNDWLLDVAPNGIITVDDSFGLPLDSPSGAPTGWTVQEI